jgi:mannobiose 2-epimerase
LQIDRRPFQNLADALLDKEQGVVYWTVDYKGHPLDTKKQIYASAFAIHGLSGYCFASGDKAVKRITVQLYGDIVNYSYDGKHGGYIEALSRIGKNSATCA